MKGKNIFIIEDCAHILPGALHKGKKIGTNSDGSFFSFDPSKPISVLNGGVAIVSNTNYYKKLKAVQKSFKERSNLGQLIDYIKIITLILIFKPYAYRFGKIVSGILYKTKIFSYNIKTSEYAGIQRDPGVLSPVVAKMANQQLYRIKEQANHRKKIMHIYHKNQFNNSLVKEIIDSPLLRYPLRVINKKDKINNFMYEQLELGAWFSSLFHPIPMESALRSPYNYISNSCPNAEVAINECVNLPTHQNISIKDAKRYVDVLKNNNKINHSY